MRAVRPAASKGLIHTPQGNEIAHRPPEIHRIFGIIGKSVLGAENRRHHRLIYGAVFRLGAYPPARAVLLRHRLGHLRRLHRGIAKGLGRFRGRRLADLRRFPAGRQRHHAQKAQQHCNHTIFHKNPSCSYRQNSTIPSKIQYRSRPPPANPGKIPRFRSISLFCIVYENKLHFP